MKPLLSHTPFNMVASMFRHLLILVLLTVNSGVSERCDDDERAAAEDLNHCVQFYFRKQVDEDQDVVCSYLSDDMYVCLEPYDDKENCFPILFEAMRTSAMEVDRWGGPDFTQCEMYQNLETYVAFDQGMKGAYEVAIETTLTWPNSGSKHNSVSKFLPDNKDDLLYFNKSLYEAEVNENEDIQHTVLTVTANNKDESSHIQYEITRGNFGGAFGVKNTTGAIFVAGPLDYETRKRYELQLVASDDLSANYTTIVIYIRDLNDNPPVFDRPIYETQITEEDDTNLPKRVLRVTATDGDKDIEPNIVYSLTGQGIDAANSDKSKFDINRTTGEIYVLKPLDRDAPNGQPQWRLTAFAQDDGGNGLLGYADVQVNLKDINDNAPRFPQGVYYGNVTENSMAGIMVTNMTAIDYDDVNEGSNAKLKYSIEKNVADEDTGSPIFNIEENTGIIKTAICCLDKERTPDYSIQVVATDGGGLRGTGTAFIVVNN